MAAAAFESYLEPTKGKGYRDVAFNGACTQYLSQDYIKQAFQAVARVRVFSGSNLNPSDPTGRADPYVVVSCGESSHTTQWKLQTLDPVWDESCYLWIASSAPLREQRLRVLVRDKDLFSSDDDMGMAYVSLGDLDAGEDAELEVELRGQGAGNGRVKLSVQLLPFTSGGSDCKVLETVTATSVGIVAGAPSAAQELVELETQGLTSADAGAPLMKKAWTALTAVSGSGSLVNAERIAYIECPDTDTQVWVHWNLDLKRVVVAFRGTEQVKWKDLATDVNLAPADLNVEGVKGDTSLFDKVFRRSEGPMVHTGFLEAWLSVRQRVLSVVDAATKRDAAWSIYMTGHSLGGALATLAAYTFANRKKNKQSVTMYNFGSPRVGNKAFADEFAELVPDAWRVHNHADVVAVVPRLMGYAHVPNGVRIQADGTLAMLDRQGVDVWGEGTSVEEVIEKLKSSLSAAEDKVNDPMRAILEHELDLLESLKGGQALAQHMEDVYLESLCNIIAEVSPDETVQATLASVRDGIQSFRTSLADAKTDK